MRATFQAAAVCADEINGALRDGTPLRTLVGPRNTGETTCSKCGRLASADEFEMRASLHVVCRACRDSVTSNRSQLAACIYAERKAFPDKTFPFTPEQEAQKILEQLETNPEGAIEDSYLPGVYRADHGPRHNRLSFDAFFQSVRRSDGTKALHSSNPLNVGGTSLWFNLGMHTSTPGMVALYLRRRDVERKMANALSEERASLLADLSELRAHELEMHSIELLTERAKSARLDGTISEKAWGRLDYQRKSGKLLGSVPVDVQERLEEYVKTPAPPKANWRPGPGTDLKDRLEHLMNGIIADGTKQTGIKVPRGPDGCLFPEDEEDRPN